jgi:prepilin peptidase CpaA
MALQTVLLLVFPILVVTAALRDLTSYTIPNWISAALILAFFPVALLHGFTGAQLGLNAAVGAGALVAGMVMFALGWIGGGDAKLFAAVSLWLGWPAVTPFLMVTCIAGGALAVVLLSVRTSVLQPLISTGPAWLSRLATRGENVPYGAAICVGALYAFPQAALMSAFNLSI